MALLQGKIAVVTGGSSGIGLAISGRFAAEGARVFITGRRQGLSVYSASKAAVRSFARTWANELRHRNIRVNALAPGSTRTSSFESFVEDDLAAKRAEEIPLGRLSTPQEQAAAALCLASGESSFITGTELAVGVGVHQF